METLKFDQKQLSAQFSDCKQLRQLVERLESEAQSSGKVLCSIRLNGMPLSEADELRFAETDIAEIQDIEIQVESTSKLVAETIITLRDGLNRLKDRTLKMADMVRENPAGPAQMEFSNLMEQTRYLTEALATLKFRVRMTEEIHSLWTTAEVSTQKMIKELLLAFSQQDFVTVGDILEYELHNLVEQWVEVIDTCDFD